EADKQLFEHYMLKEIYEQPEALENAMRGRLDDTDASAHFGGLNLDTQQLRRVERIILTGCGTSYHAALVGEYLIEEYARIPVESTKAFTTQVAVLAMLALYLGRMRHLSSIQGTRMIQELRALPDIIRTTLNCHDTVKEIAKRYFRPNNFLYLGRQYLYPVA